MKRAAEVFSRLRALPLVGVDAIAGEGNVMVLAPHPDDESLGCAGLISELTMHGRPPMVVIISDGTGSHPSSRSYPPARLRDLRESETLRAVSILGLPADRLHFLRLPDTAVPQSGPEFDSTVNIIAQLIRASDCTILCAPWLYDPHGDHESTQLIARAAARATKVTLFSYPVWGWLLADETPLPDVSVEGWRLDIQDHMDVKRQAIAAHASQYSDLITDDPEGFRLPADLLSVFDQPYEVFIETL